MKFIMLFKFTYWVQMKLLLNYGLLCKERNIFASDTVNQKDMNGKERYS